jgi:hypothetical protein
VVVRDPLVVRDTSAGPEIPILVPDDPPDSPLAPRRGVAVLPVVLVVAAVVVLVVAAAWWLTRGDDQIAVRAAVAAPAPAAVAAPAEAPAGLAVSVAAPAAVVAGTVARFVVTYSDGDGVFSGSIEDWGETGVGSLKQRACGTTTAPAASVNDSYVATHKWRTAGSYPVSFAVTTYTCRNGRATEETQKAALTVVVDPR